MKNLHNLKKGNTMVLVLLCMLIFMSMIVGFTFDARSQSIFNSGAKLHNFYRVSAEQILQTERSEMSAYWVTPNTLDSGGGAIADAMPSWRFGGLLRGDYSTTPTPGKYGMLLSEGDVEQNNGLLNLHYKLWVANNPDDPAYLMNGIYAVGYDGADEYAIVDPNWDTDGKVVLTVEMFVNDTATDPVLVLSHMVAVSGAEIVYAGTEPAQEGDDSSANNQGTGSVGTEELSLSTSLAQD
ncbi:MAG: hypothetical protein H6510_10845 [Acidobacteria bacterium]|nr:hypothetical protein [Acidobacteriota bacterium]MCB9398307.1 hypothetical protein [Acidobacteriota bacterium]